MKNLATFLDSPYGLVILNCMVVLILTAFGGFVLGYILGDRERRDRQAYTRERPDTYFQNL